MAKAQAEPLISTTSPGARANSRCGSVSSGERQATICAGGIPASRRAGRDFGGMLAASHEQVGPAERDDFGAQLAVKIARLGSQFAHVAANHDPATGRVEIAQQFERRPHRGGAGVVGVVDDRRTVPMTDFAATGGRLEFGQARGDVGHRIPRIRPTATAARAQVR